jgi:hypothetical protein
MVDDVTWVLEAVLMQGRTEMEAGQAEREAEAAAAAAKTTKKGSKKNAVAKEGEAGSDWIEEVCTRTEGGRLTVGLD